MKRFKEIVFLKGLKGVGKARIHKFYKEILESDASLEEIVEYARENEGKLSKEDIDTSYINSLSLDEYVKKHKINAITFLDEEYPEKLAVMGNKMPLILYYEGDLSLLKEKCISIIGTRNPSTESTEAEERFVRELIEKEDIVVLSGMALGCDTIAHEMTLKKRGKTIAVLPGALDRIYPKENDSLASWMVNEGGLLLSEYDPGKVATNYTFVERDAIIAALSEKVFVIECSENSGTMQTVEEAKKYGRPIAFYNTDSINEESFGGNKKISDEKIGYAITTFDDLQIFLNESAGGLKDRLLEYQCTINDIL